MLRDSCVTLKEFPETTIGIIGFGRIGSRLGKLSKSLGFNVVFHDLLKIEETHGCEQVELAQLLSVSDVVSVHVDGRIGNKHLCNTSVFEQTKSTLLFINASRGFIVDAYALADFLLHHPKANAIVALSLPFADKPMNNASIPYFMHKTRSCFRTSHARLQQQQQTWAGLCGI